MCLLITATEVFPQQKLLELGEEQNRDGGGLAYVNNGKVHFVKALKAKDMAAYAQFGPPWIFHFRLATVGGVHDSLCHPFPITIKEDLLNSVEGDANAVLAHNGNFGDWRAFLMKSLVPGKAIPAGPWSDTKAMAYLTALYGQQFTNFCDEKVAILTKEGKIIIFNENRFTKSPHDKGVMMSYDAYGRGSWKSNYSNHWEGYGDEYTGYGGPICGTRNHTNTHAPKAAHGCNTWFRSLNGKWEKVGDTPVIEASVVG